MRKWRINIVEDFRIDGGYIMRSLLHRALLTLCVLVVIVWVYPVSAEAALATRTFLLEANATYEVSYDLEGELGSDPARISLWTHGLGGDFLNASRLSGAFGTRDNHVVKLLLKTPPNMTRASVMVDLDQMDVDLYDFLQIVRKSNLDTQIATGLLQLVMYRQIYTGLVVDARGLEIQRGMSPRIWSESGQLIYGGVTAPYEMVQQQGVVSYGKEISPYLLQRVTIPGKLSYTSPLTVQAMDVFGPANTELLISEEVAQQIFEALSIYDFLADYSVVILVD